jgi:hypothetical protein
MPTNPSEEILEYFKSKAQSVPTGVPLENAGPNDPPLIDLTIPPLEEDAYLLQKSTIFDYIDQEYINQKNLKDEAILDVDELNSKFQTDLSQVALDKKLNEIIKDSGGNDKGIYSSLSYTGLTNADLKDYLKITLRKPSSTDERAIERRLNSLENTSELLDNLFRLDEEAGFFQSVLGDTLTSGVNDILDLSNLAENASEYTEATQDFIKRTLSGVLAGIINSENLQSQLKEIYGEDGVVEIFLPLPMEIWENYEHQIEQANINGFNQLLAAKDFVAGTYSLLGRLGAGAQGAASLKNLTNFKGVSAEGLGQYISGLQGSMDFVSADTRKAFNPVQEQLYRTPQPREFQWTIRIWPTSQEQAASIALIIQALKEHSSPINLGDLLYDFPGFIEFEFYINNKLARFLPRSLFYDRERKIKVPSFIKSVQVQYTGTDMYGHFVDGMPTSYVITLSIVETQPLDRNIIIGDANNNSYVASVESAYENLLLRSQGNLPNS